jgi:hypothetical protein
LVWCISSCGHLTLPNNLFVTQIIKQSINYVFSSTIHDGLPTFGQVFDPTLEEIRPFGREEFVEPILELSVPVEGNSAQIVGERESRKGGNPMGLGPESKAMWKNLPVELPNGHFRHVCSVWSGVVMLKNHSMSSTRAFLLDCFLQPAMLFRRAFSSDGQVLLCSS